MMNFARQKLSEPIEKPQPPKVMYRVPSQNSHPVYTKSIQREEPPTFDPQESESEESLPEIQKPVCSQAKISSSFGESLPVLSSIVNMYGRSFAKAKVEEPKKAEARQPAFNVQKLG
jgi:hypothetical protein